MVSWSIREAAEKSRLSQHTLRWYERIGLLGHIERRADGQRRFSDGDLDWLVLLSKLRATGMPIRDMQLYAELVRSGAREQERLDLLQRHRELVAADLAKRQESLRLLDSKISFYQRRVRAAEKEHELDAHDQAG